MRATLQVRLAKPDDVADIAVMSRDLIEHGLPWRWTAERVHRALRDPGTNVAVAVDARRLLGFGIMKYTDEEAHLLLFAVHPSSRRQGVGAALLAWLEGVARNAGLQRALLECRRGNAAARNFYGALGYQEMRLVHRMYEGIEDGITLEKWLAVESGPTGDDPSMPSWFRARK